MKTVRFVLILFAFLSCERGEDSSEMSFTLCGVSDPVNKITWLNTLVSEINSDPKYVSVVISASQYQGQTVFNIYDLISSCAYCDLRSCNGDKYTPADFNDFILNRSNDVKVWCQNAQWCSD